MTLRDPSAVETDDLQLNSFEQLSANGAVGACRRCGDPATISLTIRATPLGGKAGARAARAKAASKLCEPCAVRIFAATQKAMR